MMRVVSPNGRSDVPGGGRGGGGGRKGRTEAPERAVLRSVVRRGRGVVWGEVPKESPAGVAGDRSIVDSGLYTDK
jgi:hypothetical protein